MTATPAAGHAGTARPGQPIVNATLTVALGLALTTLPLKSVFTDWSWLLVTLVCAAPYWTVVCYLRTRSEPLWWHSLLGLGCSALVLSWIFVPQHLMLGVLPTPATGADINDLIHNARQELRIEHAPLASTNALRFMTAGLLSLLAALTDILGIGLRRPLLAAAPMLEILAVASTTSSHSTSPLWFASAGLGFLLIVLAGTRLSDQAWGPAVDGTSGRLGGVRTIAAVGVIAALVLPTVLPGRSVNILARATHHSAGGGGGGQRILSTFAALRGSLRQGTPTDLLTVHVSGDGKPFYIRQAVLDQFAADGWSQSSSSSDDTIPVSGGRFAVLPAGAGDGIGFNQIPATFKVINLGGPSLPLLANPTSLSGAEKAVWDPATATVGGLTLTRGMTYTETTSQPAPTTDQLRAAGSAVSASFAKRYVTVPQQPAVVSQLAAKLTAGKPSAYDKALAISDYFTNGRNGFAYSLDTPASDGGPAIVQFLKTKQGFCQQYAAAAAVLMREAGLPTRVVIGYTHDAPDAGGNFTVSTLDAHAWVETYFDGVGWVAFDPTPLTGADTARAVTLPWAPHSTAVAAAPGRSVDARASAAPQPVLSTSSAPTSAPAVAIEHASSSTAAAASAVVLAVVLASLVLLALPRLIRGRQRRRRIATAVRAGIAEPLWTELTASAIDHDVLWPDTLTVGQVPSWLGRYGMDERGTLAVTGLARRVERDRFGASASLATLQDEADGLDQALRRWNQQAPGRRLLFGWLPRSLLRSGRANRR